VAPVSYRMISTVGTSLLGNAARSGVDGQDAEALHALLKKDPQRASAESNALSRLTQAGDELVFLHSDTEEGARCSRVLADFYRAQGFRARSERVAGLSYDEKGFVQHGLRQLVRLLAQEIRGAQRRGLTPSINATGGFKAEIAYATAVGLVFQTPVSYIHEKFGDIVTLPATPVSWDYSLFAWYRDFFDWLDTEPRRTHEVRGRLHALPESVALLIEDAEDGHTYLSPLGEAYLEAFRGQQESRRPLLLSASAEATYKRLELGAQDRYRGVLERLRLGAPRDWQRSAEAVRGGVYKFPKGHTAERVFFSERGGKLYVLELCGHDDERRYQALIARIDWGDYDPDSFTELP
jgi:putative CRISPR-associated protein (TIGR02619 family)